MKKVNGEKVNGEKVKVLGQGQRWWVAVLVAAFALVWPIASNASEFLGMGAAYAQRLVRDRAISSLWLAPQALLSKAQEPTPPTYSLPPTTYSLTPILNWSARGAYEDWVHIDLPESFRFPLGLEYVPRITLMAWGEVCGVATLPHRVSIEPDGSSVSYGLTSSNSFLISWQNACVERSSTNRVNAAIELFPNGYVAVSMDDPLLTNPNSLNPPAVPAGFYGHGQDADWIRGNFELLQTFDSSLTNAEEIIEMGYNGWLMERAVGINVENGYYRCSVTILDLPSDGSPCYLVCGPHKVNVTQIGTYRFPLEVLETYEVRTYPEALEIILDYDDGYRGEGVSYEILDDAEEPVVAAPSRMRAAARIAPPTQSPNVHHPMMIPVLIATPSEVYINEVSSHEIALWCNADHPVRHFYSVVKDVYFHYVEPSKLQIENAVRENVIEAEYAYKRYILPAQIRLKVRPDSGIPPRTDEGVDYESATSTNAMDRTVHSASSYGNTTAANAIDFVVAVNSNQTCRVEIYVATAEDFSDQFGYCNDRVGWRVTSSGGEVFAGDWTLHDLRAGHSLSRNFTRIAERRFDPSEGESMTLHLEAWAQNIGDNLRETAIQIVVTPIPK